MTAKVSSSLNRPSEHYRIAWPKASHEQKDVALKARFEQGLSGPDMQRCLRLHASMDDFAVTVQRARRFASAAEDPGPGRSVRVAAPPPSHDSIQVIEGQASLHDKVDKLESLIRSIAQPRVRSPSPGGIICRLSQILSLIHI